MKLLIVDDHRVVRDGLKQLFAHQDQFDVEVEEAENGKMAVAMAAKRKYDVIMMDLKMPVMNGIEATRAITKDQPKAPVLILSMHDEEYTIREALQAGAKGYIMKNSGMNDLFMAIERISRGEKYFCQDAATKLIDNSLQSGKPITEKGRPKSNDIISDREKEILKMFGQDKSSDDIARKLKLSKRTIEKHKYNIMLKLGIKTPVGLAKYAMKMDAPKM